MRIEHSKKYKEKLNVSKIHGEYPYKLYVEVIGTNMFGRYIVIVSSDQIELKDPTKIKLQFVDAKNSVVKGKTYTGQIVDAVYVKRNDIEVEVYELDAVEKKAIEDKKIAEAQLRGLSLDDIKAEQERERLEREKIEKQQKGEDEDEGELNTLGLPKKDFPNRVLEKLEGKKNIIEENVDIFSKYISTIFWPLHLLAVSLTTVIFLSLAYANSKQLFIEYVMTAIILLGLTFGMYETSLFTKKRLKRLHVKKVKGIVKIVFIVISMIVSLITTVMLALNTSTNEVNRILQDSGLDLEVPEPTKEEVELSEEDRIAGVEITNAMNEYKIDLN